MYFKRNRYVSPFVVFLSRISGDQESVKEGGNTDVEEIMDDDDSDLDTKAKNCQLPSKTEGHGAATEGTTVSTKNAKKIKKYQLFLEVK